MLISKFVNIRATGSLIKKFNCKNHDIIKINIEELSNGSKAIVEVVCDYCGVECYSEYVQYINQIKTIKKYTCKSKKCKSLKSKEINLEKYGVENIFQLDSIKSKIKETNLGKYGVENVFKSETIKDKIKKTNLGKYGVENAGWLLETQSKIKKTNLGKYGVEHPLQSEIIKDKIKETNLERYGVEYPLQSKIVKDKIKKTNLKKYGVENPISLECVKSKIKETNLKRYGVENYSQSDEFIHKYKKSLSRKEYNGYSYQCKYELDFLKFCDVNNINISNHTPSIVYYMDNKKHKYFPDFYCEKFNLIIEIKSTYWYNKHINKNKEKEKQTILDGYNYIIIMDKNYDYFEKLMNKQI